MTQSEKFARALNASIQLGVCCGFLIGFVLIYIDHCGSFGITIIISNVCEENNKNCLHVNFVANGKNITEHCTNEIEEFKSYCNTKYSTKCKNKMNETFPIGNKVTIHKSGIPKRTIKTKNGEIATITKMNDKFIITLRVSENSFSNL